MADNKAMRFSAPDSNESRIIRPLALADLEGLMQVCRKPATAGTIWKAPLSTAPALPAPCTARWWPCRAVPCWPTWRLTAPPLGRVTPIHGAFEDYDDPDTLYLHDMAVSPDCAGQGLASALLMRQRNAYNWAPRHSALVSVQGSQDYWRRKGYALHAGLSDTDAAAVRGYGADAVYMVQPYRSQGG